MNQKKNALEILKERAEKNPSLQATYLIEKENYKIELEKIYSEYAKDKK